MALLLLLFGPLAFAVVLATLVLNVPALRPFRDRITVQKRPEPDVYEPMTDPVYLAALDALEAATVAAPGPDVSFELYVAPGELPGVTTVAGVPVMHSRAAEPGRPIVFDRISLRYIGRDRTTQT